MAAFPLPAERSREKGMKSPRVSTHMPGHEPPYARTRAFICPLTSVHIVRQTKSDEQKIQHVLATDALNDKQTRLLRNGNHFGKRTILNVKICNIPYVLFPQSKHTCKFANAHKQKSVDIIVTKNLLILWLTDDEYTYKKPII